MFLHAGQPLLVLHAGRPLKNSSAIISLVALGIHLRFYLLDVPGSHPSIRILECCSGPIFAMRTTLLFYHCGEHLPKFAGLFLVFRDELRWIRMWYAVLG